MWPPGTVSEVIRCSSSPFSPFIDLQIFRPRLVKLVSAPLRPDPTRRQDASLRIRTIPRVRRLVALVFALGFSPLRCAFSRLVRRNVLFFPCVTGAAAENIKRRGLKPGEGAAALFSIPSVLSRSVGFKMLRRRTPAATSCWFQGGRILPRLLHKFLQVTSLLSRAAE